VRQRLGTSDQPDRWPERDERLSPTAAPVRVSAPTSPGSERDVGSRHRRESVGKLDGPLRLPTPGDSSRAAGDAEPIGGGEHDHRRAERFGSMSATAPGVRNFVESAAPPDQRPPSAPTPVGAAEVRSDPAHSGGPAPGPPTHNRYIRTAGFGFGGFDWTASSS
jgi:hypothetical protein